MKDYFESAELSRDQYMAAVIILFAQCLEEPETYRIILDVDGDGITDYFMIDFSACGIPFDDGTRVSIIEGGDVCDGNEPYWDFKNLRKAMTQTVHLMERGFSKVWIETF